MNQVTPTPTLSARHVPGGNGLAWWSQSFSWLFGDLSGLVVWVLMGLFMIVSTTVLHFVPGVGSIASFLLGFVLSGGMMLAAHKRAQGEAVRFADLFGGFGPNAGALLGVGLLALLAMTLVGGLMLLIGLGAAIAAFAGAWNDPDMASNAMLGTVFGTSVPLLLLCLCLLIPLSMALWLAPALIVLRGARPIDALRLSLVASWRSGAALTVYGIAFVFLSIAATLLFAIGWVFLVPLLYLSTYAAYRDLLEGDAPALPADAVLPS
jgi:hypothetical protein